MSGRIGALLLKSVLALCLAGLVLGVALPVLDRRGVAVPQWAALTMAAVFIGAVIWRDLRVLRTPK